MSTPITEAAQYITFKLGQEMFAINVAQVREVLEMSLITKVPSAPDYMRGVVNVRGKAIPVVDLRLKFGLAQVKDTVNTRIVVMELGLDGESTIVGGIADSVHEVIELEPSQIDPPPRLAMRWRTELIRGMGRRGDQFIIILDIGAVFSLEELAIVSDSGALGGGDSTVLIGRDVKDSGGALEAGGRQPIEATANPSLLLKGNK